MLLEDILLGRVQVCVAVVEGGRSGCYWSHVVDEVDYGDGVDLEFLEGTT